MPSKQLRKTGVTIREVLQHGRLFGNGRRCQRVGLCLIRLKRLTMLWVVDRTNPKNPCCRITHPVIDAMLMLVVEYRRKPDGVERVLSWTHPWRLQHCPARYRRLRRNVEQVTRAHGSC